jgi:acetyl esterase/lipase
MKFMFSRRYYYNIIPEIDGLPWRMPDEIAFFVSCITGNGEGYREPLPPTVLLCGRGDRVKKSGEELATQLDDQKIRLETARHLRLISPP